MARSDDYILKREDGAFADVNIRVIDKISVMQPHFGIANDIPVQTSESRFDVGVITQNMGPKAASRKISQNRNTHPVQGKPQPEPFVSAGKARYFGEYGLL